MQYISESIILPAVSDSAFSVLSDPEKLFRLSPCCSVKDLKQLSPISETTFGKGCRYDLKLEYYGKDLVKNYGIEVIEFSKNEKTGLSIEDELLKQIYFIVDKSDGGIKLTGRFLVVSNDEKLLNEAGSELRFWLRSIAEYIKLSDRQSLRKRLLKWFMDKAWLNLSLQERKIAIIMFKVSVIEILFLVIMVIVWNISITLK